MDKYIIKITRKTPETWVGGGEEEIHYYSHDCDSGEQYIVTKKISSSHKLTKQESKKKVKEIEQIYKRDTNSGTLLKIEVLNSETLKPINMNESKYTKFTRFEIMEI